MNLNALTNISFKTTLLLTAPFVLASIAIVAYATFSGTVPSDVANLMRVVDALAIGAILSALGYQRSKEFKILPANTEPA